jgi:SAM-dependent methyltransferase
VLADDVFEPTTYWERVATTKWGEYTSRVEERAIREANRLAPLPRAALEIGCEGGRWSRLLSDLNWSVACTDVNQDSLDICQRRLPEANCILVQPDDRTIPCETGSLGLILCIEVYPVVDSEWFFREARRTLAPGALIVGVTLNKHSLRGLLVRARDRRSNQNPNHDHYLSSYRQFKQRAQAHGFEMLHSEGCCWFPFRRDSNSSLVPIFTGLERMLRLPRLPGLSPWVVFIAQKQCATCSGRASSSDRPNGREDALEDAVRTLG